MLNCGIVLHSLPSFGQLLQILDGHLKKTSFGRMFIILTAFGLLINFMMASQNLSLLQYSWRSQLAKQSLYKIFPLPFNVSYFLDNRYRHCQCVQYTHRKSNKITPDIACKCLNTILTSQFYYLDICFQEQPKMRFRGLRYSKCSGPCQHGFAPYSREHALRQIYPLDTQVTDPGQDPDLCAIFGRVP